MTKILHCYSKGDKRFSAFCANVTINGVTDSIEFWYQLSKNFDGIPTVPNSAPWKAKMSQVKTIKSLQKQVIKPTSINILNKELPPDFLTEWYKMLWYTYLENNPDLVKYANQFDDFLDIYARGSVNNQADVIRQYVKEGKESLKNDFHDLLTELRK